MVSFQAFSQHARIMFPAAEKRNAYFFEHIVLV